MKENSAAVMTWISNLQKGCDGSEAAAHNGLMCTHIHIHVRHMNRRYAYPHAMCPQPRKLHIMSANDVWMKTRTRPTY